LGADLTQTFAATETGKLKKITIPSIKRKLAGENLSQPVVERLEKPGF